VKFQSNPISSYGDTSLHTKIKPRISKSKKGDNYVNKQQKQIRVLGLVPIMLDNSENV
jgi:hypothetical protein